MTVTAPERLASEVAEASRLKEGPAGVDAVLRLIFQSGQTGVKPLARKAHLPVPVLSAVLGELAKRNLVLRQDGISLTPTGQDYVKDHLGIHSAPDWLCKSCNGKTVILPARLKPAVERLASWASQAPGVDTALDQAPSTPESAVRRAIYMIQQGAVEGRKVLILGDDDSLSLAIGLVGLALSPGRGFAARLTVIESDPRWTSYLRDAAQKESLSIELIEADLRDPLPPDLQASFDTFETDPPYTLSGMSLFTSRGIEALSLANGGQGFLSLGSAPPEDMLAYQGALTSMGLTVAGLLPNFNVYQGASLLGGTSHLYHLVAAESAFPLITGPYHEEEIYTGRQNPVLRVYRCLGCGRTYKIGQGQEYPTIEKLKASGCPACGTESFELAARILRQ
jgi:N4-bis(aminopropyl)spermidine synthase